MFCFLHPDKLIADKYPNKYNHYSLSSIIIIKKGVKRVIRREQLGIAMKHIYLQDKELNLNSQWIHM